VVYANISKLVWVSWNAYNKLLPNVQKYLGLKLIAVRTWIQQAVLSWSIRWSYTMEYFPQYLGIIISCTHVQDVSWMYSTGYWCSIYLDGSKEIFVHRYSRYCTTRVITGLSCTLMWGIIKKPKQSAFHWYLIHILVVCVIKCIDNIRTRKIKPFLTFPICLQKLQKWQPGI
jgi:hypothetical protein